MREPLEIFEKHPDADAYRVGGFYSPYALVSQDKRFTDAELAAEWHQSRKWAGMGRGWMVRQRSEVIRLQAVQEMIRADIVHRFADLPHFDA